MGNVMTKDDGYTKVALNQRQKDSPDYIKFVLPWDQDVRGLGSRSTCTYASSDMEAHNTSLEVVALDMVGFAH